MPNHVVNELIFRDVPQETRQLIIDTICDEKGDVDFEKLLPMPLNAWRGSVGSNHEKAFPQNGMDWANKNWSTKWNAYSHKPTETTDDSITFRFETAWRPPYGWLVAVLNTLKISFEHNWLSEGESVGHRGTWKYGKPAAPFSDYEWKEEVEEVGTPLQRHLHLLQWGCEEFPDDEDTDD